MPEFEELDAESLGPRRKSYWNFLKNRVNGQDKVLNSFIKAIDLLIPGFVISTKPIHTAYSCRSGRNREKLCSFEALPNFGSAIRYAYLEISMPKIIRREKDILSNIPSIETKGVITSIPCLGRR